MGDRGKNGQARLITVITSSKDFQNTIQNLLGAIKNKKDEFADVEVQIIPPGANTEWGRRLTADMLNRTFLLFCDKEYLWKLIGKLKEKYTIPVIALADRYEIKTIDEVFQIRYLYIRGVATKTVGDPEDLGLLTRTIKDEFRKALILEGRTITKRVGWRIDASPEARTNRSFVSLFVDPVMREFMQRLIFTIDSVQMSMPERPFESDAEVHKIFRELENKDLRDDVEAEALRTLSEGPRNNAAEVLRNKPQPILLEGETGTGKTVIAEWIHRHLSTPLKPLPFQRISTVNIGANILEAELFGTVKGAWTDAVSRPGKLLLAWGGVVFLDEIGELPPDMQSKFLVYLDEFKFTPDGWPYSWKIFSPVYIIAATNRNLRQAVESGGFRRDLYHRFPYRLRVPSLRERRSDLRPLIDILLQDRTINTNGWVEEISLSAIARLESYDFPGNFRELESILGRAVFRAMQARRRSVLEADLEF